MELLASPSLFFAFLVGTAFGDLLAGRFPLANFFRRSGCFVLELSGSVCRHRVAFVG